MGNNIVARTAPHMKSGVRERKKLDKRERIRAAARALFAEVGYDEAALRQIAKRAEIGLGTLFDYVSNKRDLVFLICNEEFDAAVKEALAAALYEETLFDQLIAFFDVIYAYLARDIGLSRLMLRELLFFTEGEHAAYYLEIRAHTLKGLGRLVRTAQKTGDIGCTEDPDVIARHIFFAASGAGRWWIASENPDPASGIKDLARLMAIQFQGLSSRTTPSCHPSVADGQPVPPKNH